MRSAQQTLDATFAEMRWRCLSLAADLDRIQRADGGTDVISTDDRIRRLRESLALLLGNAPDRAEHVQLIFSDRTKS